MFGALFSFLGGSVFRMVWGEVASFMQKRQDHAHELEMMKAQAQLEDARAERQMAQIKQQSELGIKEVQIAGDLAIQKSEADAFLAAMQSAGKPIGIVWVDAWNGSVRPAYATVALALWGIEIVASGFVLTAYDMDLIGVVAGFFFASRELTKRGK
jgi:hypothetical protein